jgi:hypothetical protein
MAMACDRTYRPYMKLLTYIYLRLFAFTLGRKSRNSADNACDDAIMLTGIALSVPLLFVYLGIACLAPNVGKHIVGVGAIITVVVVIGPLMYWVNRQFTHYRLAPSAATPFGAGYQRAITIVTLLVVLMSAPVTIGLLFRLLFR